ncbi:trithorax group protein osa-like [Schistocerca nitens]|uniref:trithorax group protein osa-like n=1 Tax=Schistocerca nitens TaxID=7011 RepID=UPI002119A6FC|nr:trithorax group protein osa-like [Schistocerca nitens]
MYQGAPSSVGWPHNVPMPPGDPRIFGHGLPHEQQAQHPVPPNQFGCSHEPPAHRHVPLNQYGNFNEPQAHCPVPPNQHPVPPNQCGCSHEPPAHRHVPLNQYGNFNEPQTHWPVPPNQYGWPLEPEGQHPVPPNQYAWPHEQQAQCHVPLHQFGLPQEAQAQPPVPPNQFGWFLEPQAQRHIPLNQVPLNQYGFLNQPQDQRPVPPNQRGWSFEPQSQRLVPPNQRGWSLEPQAQRPVPPNQYGLSHEPGAQRPVHLNQYGRSRDPRAQRPVTQEPVHQYHSPPSTNVPSHAFQPVLQSSLVDNPAFLLQKDGRSLQMSPVSPIRAPSPHFGLPEQCLRCCVQRESQALRDQPDAQEPQGGQLPTADTARNAMQGAQERPQPNVVQNAVPAPHQVMNPFEVCQRCCSAKEPALPVVSNLPHNDTPAPFQLYDSLESVTIGGGERGNEFLVVDPKSGIAEQFQMLHSGSYTLRPAQGTRGNNIQSPAPAQDIQPTGSVQQESPNWPPSAHIPPPLQVSGARGVQLPQQSEAQGLTQRTAKGADVYARLPDASELNEHLQSSLSDATESQILRAAIAELSQSKAKSPAVFVRIPDATEVNQQHSTNMSAGRDTPMSLAYIEMQPFPQQAQEAPRFNPPVTEIGARVLEVLQEKPPQIIKRQSHGYVNDVRSLMLRRHLRLLLQAGHVFPHSHDIKTLQQLKEYLEQRRKAAEEASVVDSEADVTPLSVTVVENQANETEDTPQPTTSQAAAPPQPQRSSETTGSELVSTETGQHVGSQASAKENASQPTTSQAAAPVQPQRSSETARSEFVPTEIGQQGGRQAPAAAHDLQPLLEHALVVRHLFYSGSPFSVSLLSGAVLSPRPAANGVACPGGIPGLCPLSADPELSAR